MWPRVPKGSRGASLFKALNNRSAHWFSMTYLNNGFTFSGLSFRSSCAYSSSVRNKLSQDGFNQGEFVAFFGDLNFVIKG